ncbi:class I SAM-dependent methyltransferase [Geomonas nitrogeniifigens]|uniref:Class I SAM-dependent methyltransferase n=2 Tax=Geomonas diazotrophica TaxID=2843197 RepID=A0ABX8JN46_9BACT|nr:class I SAM-dependent methyltransferase [Geomonas nitrogeniifigens]
MSMIKSYHEIRLPYDQRRDLLWKTLCDAYFQPLIPEQACVLEMGAGYCHFINHVRCARRIALDLWEGMPQHAAPGVETIVGSATDLSRIPERSVDFAFASNLFEHMDQDDFARTLDQLRDKLTPGGTLNLLQPNYRFAYREYFDDFSHRTVYTDRSLSDFLACHGFRVIHCAPRFLPLTVKSALPVSPFLIRLYLRLPFKPLGKQMLVRAVAA